MPLDFSNVDQPESDLSQATQPSQDSAPSDVIENEDGTVQDLGVSSVLDSEAGENKAGTEIAYQANTKFKVLDQEKEFDDWAKPFVNKDNESKFRELYEKAHGLDVVKPKLHETRQELQQAKQYIQTREASINEILSYRKTDLDRFFESVELPPQEVAKWLMKKIEVQNLPPEQQSAYNEADRLRRENYELQKKTQQVTSLQADSAIQARVTELSRHLSQPEVAPLVEQYNSRMGNPGAFADLVARHGNAEWVASNGQRDLSVEEAVSDVIKILGLQSQAASPAATPSGVAPAVPRPKVVVPSRPTVIPNVGNSASSPVSTKPKNLADLRKMAAAARP